jgi:Flp pilus assembly secretin CpaC
LALLLLFAAPALAQTSNPANSPASTPAGTLPPVPERAAPAKPAPPSLSAKQLRDADDAYLDGAKQIEHKDVAAAMHDFERAVRLNPNNRDYALALIVARESRVTELVQNAAKARLSGDTAQADTLLNEARALDPDNSVVAQHFGPKIPAPAAVIKPGLLYSSVDPATFPAEDIASTLAGPVELAPTTGTKDIHLHGDSHSAIRTLYSQFGITTVFDSSVTGGPFVNIDMTKATFADATRVLALATHIFAVPVQPKVALIAKDTQEMRDQLMPQVEETIYLPGMTNDAMQELANVARNVFDVKQVATSATGGYMLLRGDENVLREVNATYDDMLDGGSEVLFDINLYEVDKTSTRDIGAVLPSSAGIFSVTAEAQSIVSANQSIITQAVSAGLLTLNGSYLQNLISELEFLVASGSVTATQYTNLLGVFGNGLTFAGLFLGSNSSFNLLLNSTDTRTLDAVQIRSSDHQPVNFRAGTRYPVITANYSSGIGNSLPASLSGLNINGTSVSSLLSKYLGTSTVSVPQFQFEDLGITLKITPHILHSTDVSVQLEMKIEALAGSSINNIPILNNRAITSTIIIPGGQTAMLASLVSTNEIKALTGLPGLSELPGFQGTDQDREKDSTELLITITPHIVRSGRLNIASRRLAAVRSGSSATP